MQKSIKKWMGYIAKYCFFLPFGVPPTVPPEGKMASTVPPSDVSGRAVGKILWECGS